MLSRLKKVQTRSITTTPKLAFRQEPGQASNMTEIGLRRIFNEDHDAFRETARKWFNNVIKPEHSKWEDAGIVPREIWEDAGKNGLLGCNTSEKYGGIGADILYSAILWEEQAYVNCSGPGFPLHSDICMPYIENWGTEEQKHHYLPIMTSGKCISAIAMTEPSTGSDLQGVKTIAVKDGDDWILNGSKTFITNGQNCDVVIVVAVTNPKAKIPAHGMSLLLVDTNLPGFKKGKNLKKLGTKAQDTSELFFEDVRVPSSAILGGEKGLNKGFIQLMRELPQERLMIAGACVAGSEGLFEITRNYIKERIAFGKPLTNLQTIRHDMAHIKTEIVKGRAFTDQCLELHANKKLTTEMASMAKMAISDMNQQVLDKMLQLHGGYGFMWEYEIAKAFADSRVQRIYGGTNEIMKEMISRDIVS